MRTVSSERGKLLVKQRNRLDAAIIIFERDVFIRGMCIFVRQPKPIRTHGTLNVSCI